MIDAATRRALRRCQAVHHATHVLVITACDRRVAAFGYSPVAAPPRRGLGESCYRILQYSRR